MRPSIYFLIGILLLFSESYAVKKLGQTGMKWLDIPSSARSVGMGTAYTTIDNDISSVFWNPAGSVQTDSYVLQVTMLDWIGGIKSSSAVLGIPIASNSSVSVFVHTVSYGEITSTIQAENENGYEVMGTFNPGGSVLGVAYGQQITDRFGFGVNLKYCREELGTGWVDQGQDIESFENSLSVVAIDVGTLYMTGYKDLRIGMSLRNFSQEVSYIIESFPLPLTFSLGLSADLLKVANVSLDSQSLMLAMDLLHPRDYDERIHLGLEYSFDDKIFLRSGYKFNYDEESLTAGVGLNIDIGSMLLKFDYAFSEFETFTPIHHFSLGVGF